MQFARLAIVIMSVVVASCDRISGLRTDAKLANAVDLACVDRTMREMPDIGVVSPSSYRSESFQILPYRGKVITVSNYWRYSRDGRAVVQITDDGEERSYFNGMQKLGAPYSQEELRVFAPLMQSVNQALEKGCHLPLRAMGKITRD